MKTSITRVHFTSVLGITFLIIVPHEHHFLSRLDRIALPHVELALSLYRDHELLHYLLGQVRLPDRAERVAISLDDPAEGPFLLVTREGRFVTCLGRGMRPGDLPVISRGQLDGITAKITSHRARVEARQKLLGPGGETGELLKRIISAGPDLSREEFIAVSSVQPLLARDFFRLLIEIGVDVEETRDALVPVLKRTDKPRPVYRPALIAYWKQLWATGHLAVLAAMGGELFHDVETSLSPPELLLSRITVQQGILALACKGAFGVAKVGKSMLAHYKHAYASARDALDLVDAGVCLFALGSRHARLRAEAQKTLFRDLVHASATVRGTGQAIAGFTATLMDRAEEAAVIQRDVGAKMALALTAHLPKGASHRFEREKDVPEDLAMSLAVTSPAEFIANKEHVIRLFVTLPWVARASPEQLYLPAEFIKATRSPWRPESTLALLTGWMRVWRAPSRKKPEGPPRGGPCPCGSGKKYKRCCAPEGR